MSFFDKVQKRVSEQENIYCPFCNCGFVSKKEHRPFINCPACNGYAKLAVKAMKEVETVLKNLHEYPTEQIEEFVKKLCSGLHRSEFRTYLMKERGWKPKKRL